MRFIDEFRDSALGRRILQRIRHEVNRPLSLMEVCGTHTVALSRSGIRQLVPPELTLLPGPGCPVCVTAQEEIDKALALARNPEVILATFGDMMKVPGSHSSLEVERARGADVRVVYSPTDALKIAQRH
ncbi:MAG: hydrogenase formation protein HypD, partial [Anaerolineae bacterium]